VGADLQRLLGQRLQRYARFPAATAEGRIHAPPQQNGGHERMHVTLERSNPPALA